MRIRAGPDQRPRVVIGVDIGTTSTKAVAYDTDGRQLASHSVGYPLDEPHPGYAEQDPELILDAVRGDDPHGRGASCPTRSPGCRSAPRCTA